MVLELVALGAVLGGFWRLAFTKRRGVWLPRALLFAVLLYGVVCVRAFFLGASFSMLMHGWLALVSALFLAVLSRRSAPA